MTLNLQCSHSKQAVNEHCKNQEYLLNDIVPWHITRNG